jgi:polar amino acid transport system substrate-binding protein
MLVIFAAPASARPLDQVIESGNLALCAHPNALPFSAKEGERHGFQIEMAEALAKSLNVALETNWVITGFDRNRTECDIVIDAIADAEAQEENHIKLSKPYRRSGVALAVRADDGSITSIGDLDNVAKVGILPGSMAAMVLGKRGVRTTPSMFEDDLLDEVASGEIAAAAVTPTAIGYYNGRHADHKLKMVDAFAAVRDLTWNVAVGMVKADPPLVAAIDAALDKMSAAGTIKEIYARYGVELLPPK